MRLVDYLDKGASVDPGAPCLTTDGMSSSYAEVRELSFRIATALDRHGVAPGDKVAILSANDPVAFTCVFGISRAGAVWCPINPRNEAAENRELLDLFDCTVLIHQQSFAPLVAQIRGRPAEADDGGLPRRSSRQTAPCRGRSSSARSRPSRSTAPPWTTSP